MRRTTPRKLRTEIEAVEEHTHKLERLWIVREDASYYDGRGLVEHEDYEITEFVGSRYLEMVFRVETSREDQQNFAWAIPPAGMVWEWWTTQNPNDVAFNRALIRTELTLTQFQIHVVNSSEVLVILNYQYDHALEEIEL